MPAKRHYVRTVNMPPGLTRYYNKVNARRKARRK
jgi:hypothetical protein